MADKFKEMDAFLNNYAGRVMYLPVGTSNAFHVTHQGIIAMIKLLLGFTFVLPGTFQSDRFEVSTCNHQVVVITYLGKR